jgi:hypothetical protein
MTEEQDKEMAKNDYWIHINIWGGHGEDRFSFFPEGQEGSSIRVQGANDEEFRKYGHRCAQAVKTFVKEMVEKENLAVNSEVAQVSQETSQG